MMASMAILRDPAAHSVVHLESPFPASPHGTRLRSRGPGHAISALGAQWLLGLGAGLLVITTLWIRVVERCTSATVRRAAYRVRSYRSSTQSRAATRGPT